MRLYRLMGLAHLTLKICWVPEYLSMSFVQGSSSMSIMVQIRYQSSAHRVFSCLPGCVRVVLTL